MARQNIELQKELEPKRFDYAIEQLTKIGKEIIYKDSTKLKFDHINEQVTLFPYSGWHSGKSIKDGRGIDKLLKQLK
jgi:hypothetical protein